MTGAVSTIIVMGPQGSGKSEFINLLAGTIKLQPNGDPTDSLRVISVSPYFSDGETVKFVKFPGFDESGTDPTDAKLFIGLVTFLEGLRRRGEVVRSIIYMHPITNDGLNPANVKFNVEMLQEIAKDAIGNVVIVTTKWDRVPDSSRDSMEAQLRNGLMRFYQDPIIRHDGTKWSALSILNNAKKKPTTLLDLKNQIPSATSAGKVLIDHINRLMQSKRVREADLERELEIAETEDNNRKDELNVSLGQVVGAIRRLRDDKGHLRGRIDWDQAVTDNKALEGVIKERRDSATKDWKAEYEKLVNESKAKAAESEKLLNAKVAECDRLVKENKAFLIDAVGYRNLSTLLPFTVRMQASESYFYLVDSIWIGYSANEVLYSTGWLFPSNWGDLYLVRNNAGRIGVAYAKNFVRI